MSRYFADWGSQCGGYTMSESMKLVSVKITNEQLDVLDELCRKNKYPTRSEAIRTAIRDLIRSKKGSYR